MRLLQVCLITALYICASLEFIAAKPQHQQQLQPLRSIQLGGTGVRPVSLGSNPAIPNYSQQLAFSPQYQFQNQQHQLQQQQQQPQLIRAQIQPQAQNLQPTYQQRPLGSFPPLQNAPARPLAPHPQPILLNSPTTTAASSEEEEYEDEYDDAPPQQQQRQQVPVGQQQQPIRQLQPQIRPLVLAPTPAPPPPPRQIPQRSPIRIQQQQQPQPLSPIGSPSRFVVAQPQQQQQQQVRRPAQVQQAQPLQRPQHQLQQQQLQQPIRLGQDSRLISGDRGSSTPAPIQTIDRYMRTNDDGSTSWGYTNEDGTFKEETLGVDCVVRGKYGYVDPDGVKREYEYQSGNPCDPNKRDQSDEEEEEEIVVGQQPRHGGGLLLNSAPIQYQPQLRQQRPQPQLRQQ